MAVAAEVEQDGLGAALALAAQRLLDRALDGVGGLGRRHDALGAREQHAGGEAFALGVGAGLDQAQLLEVRDQRRHAVVAQPTGVEARRREGAAHITARR